MFRKEIIELRKNEENALHVNLPSHRTNSKVASLLNQVTLIKQNGLVIKYLGYCT